MKRLICAVWTVMAMATAGCGASSETDSKSHVANAATSAAAKQSPTPTPTPDPAASSRRVLTRWDRQLVPLLMVARDRAKASEAGKTLQAQQLEKQLNQGLRRVRRYGRDARKAMIAALDSPAAVATIAAGDAFSEWADELYEHPPAGDFKQARHVADLGARMVKEYQDACRAARMDVPVAWRSS